MFVAVVHKVKDPQSMLSRGEGLGDPDNAPAGAIPRQFCPSKDLTAATCVWEADSIDTVREYIDGTLGDSSEQSYFEINTEYAQGLPEPVGAKA